MDWYIQKEEGEPQLRVADKDITVYKMMRVNIDGELTSHLHHIKYEPEVKYVLTEGLIVEEKNNLYVINKGFHSYSGKCVVSADKLIRGFFIYEPSANGWYGDFLLKYPNDSVLAECVIPKLSHYYENKRGMIVSDNIIVTGEIRDINEWKKLLFKQSSYDDHFCFKCVSEIFQGINK